MEKEITIQATDGSGSFSAYVCQPEKPQAAVLVIQEIFGVNAGMRSICKDLAAQGYMAVCPDLFWRQEPGVQLTDQTEAEWDHAFTLYKGFNVDKGVEDLKATLAAIRASVKKVGTVGFCLGGKLAYLMATRSDVDCAVSYYGVDLPSFLNEAGNIKKPLLMHIAALDEFVPENVREKIKSTLSGKAEIYVYEGVDHAFARPNGVKYNAAAAKLANERTSQFLKKNLTGS